MNSTIKTVVEKTVVVEACGTRKAIKNTKFVPTEGYIGDCAVMGAEEAETLIRGEQLTRDYLNRCKHLKKDEVIPPEEKRGKVVNFRFALKVGEKPKKVGV